MKLKDCDNCLVYGSDKKPLARARAVMVEENVFRLYFGNYKLRNAKLKTIVDFYDGQQGLVRCQCDLVVKQKNAGQGLDGEWMAEGTISKVFDVVQRQKDLRVEVAMKAEFNSLTTGYFSGTIQNISAGGIFLLTSHALKKNELFSFHPRLGEGMVSLEAKVVRVGALVKGEYSYGCQFVGISLDSEASVRKFVYMKQKERQNRLGKRA